MHAALGAEELQAQEALIDIDLYLRYAAEVDRPEKLPFGVSPRGAELYVSEWLKYLDFQNIVITPPRRDGGYDIEADEYVVEVKNWNKDWLPVSAVREIFGVAVSMQKSPMIFSRGFLSEDAKQFAEINFVPVFLFNAEEALLQAGNSHAKAVIEKCLGEKAFRMQRDVAKAAGLLVGTLLVEYCNKLANTIDFLETIEPEDGNSIFTGSAENLREMARNTTKFLAEPLEEVSQDGFELQKIAGVESPLNTPNNVKRWLETRAVTDVLDKAKHVHEATSAIIELLEKFQEE